MNPNCYIQPAAYKSTFIQQIGKKVSCFFMDGFLHPTVQTILWILTPESTQPAAQQPLSVEPSGRGAVKTLFWLIVSIAIGMLLANFCGG